MKKLTLKKLWETLYNMERAKKKMLKADKELNRKRTTHQDIKKCSLRILSDMTRKQLFQLLMVSSFYTEINTLILNASNVLN